MIVLFLHNDTNYNLRAGPTAFFAGLMKQSEKNAALNMKMY